MVSANLSYYIRRYSKIVIIFAILAGFAMIAPLSAKAMTGMSEKIRTADDCFVLMIDTETVNSEVMTLVHTTNCGILRVSDTVTGSAQKSAILAKTFKENAYYDIQFVTPRMDLTSAQKYITRATQTAEIPFPY